jgi:eukaryotic-like serine/threonine-protein kinase
MSEVEPDGGAARGCFTEAQVMAYLTTRPPPLDPAAVAAHIDHCVGCRLLMVEAARGLGSRAGDGAPARLEATLAVGERVDDRFQILRFLARGGMGEVYEARDLQLQEAVALKTLALTALDDEAALTRFKAEVRLARRVNHPNVCRILEYGLHVVHRRGAGPESVPFLTMDLLEGETLAARVRRRGAFSPAEAHAVAGPIVEALVAIHRAGVVHRDLKSENVFLVPEKGGGERVVVMDFGLARALDGSVISTWPMAAMVVGTLETMAPEQIEGRRPGPAADVFAFGVLLFELLSGKRPFTDVPPLDRLRREPPRLSSVTSGLPAGWHELVDGCLERDPDRRWAGAGELRQKLASPALVQLGPGAGPTVDGAGGRGRRWGAAALVLGLGLVVGLTLALALLQSR